MQNEIKRKHLFQLCLILTLLIFCFAYYLAPRKITNDDKKLQLSNEERTMILVGIKTTQKPIKIAPSIPQLAIPEDIDNTEDDPEDIDIVESVVFVEEDTSTFPVTCQINEIHERVEIYPEINHKVPIIYPPIARRLNLEGAVYIRFVIDIKGYVISAELIKGNKILVESAINAIKKYQFRPAVQNGRYVKFRMLLPVKFKLS